MTPDLPTTAEISPDPRLEKRTRRRFSAAEKLRLLSEADALPHGEQGAWLRRNGLYAAQLSGWRKQHVEHGLDGLQTQAPGRKAADPRDRRIDQLQRENRRLHRRAEVAEQLVDLQKKVFQLVEKAQQETRS
ncbi:MAG: transposase [Giesbergeria sp.]